MTSRPTFRPTPGAAVALEARFVFPPELDLLRRHGWTLDGMSEAERDLVRGWLQRRGIWLGPGGPIV